MCKPTKAAHPQTPEEEKKNKTKQNKRQLARDNWEEACMQDNTNLLINEIDVVGDRTILEARGLGTQLGNFVSVLRSVLLLGWNPCLCYISIIYGHDRLQYFI